MSEDKLILLARELSGITRDITNLSKDTTHVKTLLGNHLAHHDKYFKYLMCPIFVGVTLLVTAKVYEYIQTII